MDTLYSCSIKAGPSTYFIDVKQAKGIGKHIVISQNVRGETEMYRSYIVLKATPAVDMFLEHLGEAVELIRPKQPEKVKP